jgi:prepilin-type N-terminal cleavage/methylation domain-containing protein
MQIHKEHIFIAPRKRIGGFSLIESLVALLLLAFVLAGAGYMMLSSVQTGREARHFTAAFNLAQDQMERLLGTDYDAMSNGSDGPFNEAGGSTGSALMYTRTWTVVANTGSSGGAPVGTSELTVITSWISQDGQDHQIQVQSIRRKL